MERIWITCAADLGKIGRDPAFPANGDYILHGDVAVGGDWESLPHASGIKLDGDGHRIGPLNMPLFWSLEDAAIRNLTLDLNIRTRSVPAPNNYGAVAGLAQSAYRTLIENCTSYGSVEGHFAVAGLCGNLNDCDMLGCVNYAALRVESSEAGGIAAFANNTNFFHCRNHGSITSSDSETRFGLGDIGGIVGTLWATWDALESTYAIVDCFNDGEITAYRTGGGIVGFLRGGDKIRLEVLRCVNRGQVRGSLRAREDPMGGVLFGGIVGQGVSFTRVQDCLNSGDISGCGSVGGIIGEARHPKWGWRNVSDLPPPDYSNRVERCENQGSVRLYKPASQDADPSAENADSEKAPCKAGGVAGALLFMGCVRGCENHGAVVSEGALTGGIVGLVRTGAVEKCENKAPVTSQGSCCGGVAGRVDRVLDHDSYPMPHARNVGIVESCVNRGPVRVQGGADRPSGQAGGIVGALLNGSDVIDCRNCAEIIAKGDYAGGIVGYCALNGSIACGHVEQNRQTGPAVAGRAHVHRILGGRGDAASVTLDNNEAAQDTMLTGDNTTDSGLVYEARVVRLDDPLLSPDGFQGDTAVCGRSKRLSCEGCVADADQTM
ncbi:MAG: hypothetical protein LBH66_07930 [Oscillospiraceae bacterium]|jgi:hypothetical protein|nr:hypothetical protein [Oscillospiraceae bacterium]